LLLPALSFVSKQYSLAKEEGEQEDEDYMLIAKELCHRLAQTTKPYIKKHLGVFEMVNEVIKKNEVDDVNFFLIGISLVLLHHEIATKTLPVSLFNQCNALIDIFSKEGGSELINDSSDYALRLSEDLRKRILD